MLTMMMRIVKEGQVTRYVVHALILYNCTLFAQKRVILSLFRLTGLMASFLYDREVK